MNVSLLLQLITSLPSIFASPLPWQAELAFLILCVFIIGLPAIIKSFRQSTPHSSRTKGKNRQQTSEQHRNEADNA